MAVSFAEIAKNRDYLELPPNAQQQLRAEFFQKRVASLPDFQQLGPDQQSALQQEFEAKYTPQPQAMNPMPDYSQGMPMPDYSGIGEPMTLEQNLARYSNPQADALTSNVISRLQAPPAPPQPNAFSDFTGGALNALSGFNLDEAVRNSGGGFAAGAGTLLGSAVPFLAVGGGLGMLNPVAGALGAGAIGGELSLLNDLQQQRLEGQQGLNKTRALGAFGLGAIESAIPGVGKGLSLVPRIALNAGLQGGVGAIGEAGRQAFEQGTLTPELSADRIRAQALLGAAGGGVEGFLTRAPQQNVNVNAPVNRQSVFIDIDKAESDLAAAVNNKQRLEKRLRTNETNLQNTIDIAQNKINNRQLNKTEFAKYQQNIKNLDQLKTAQQQIDASRQRIIELSSVGKRSDLPPPELGQPKPNIAPQPPRVDIALTPEQQARATALTESFQQRQPQVDIAIPQRREIITPDQLRAEAEQAALGELSRNPVVEQVSDTGVMVARRGETTSQPQIEVARPDLPSGRTIDIGRPLETQSIIDPATGQPYRAPEQRLRTSADIATQKAFSPETDTLLPRQAVDIGAPRQTTPQATRPVDIIDPTRPTRPEKPVDILRPDGSPAKTPQPVDIGIPRQEPLTTQPDAPVQKAAEAQPDGESLFIQRQDIAPESQQKAQADILAEIEKNKGRQISFAEAQRFVQENGTPEELQHLQTFMDSGKRNELYDFDNNPRERPNDLDTRQVAPVAFELRPFSQNTEAAFLNRKYKQPDGTVDYDGIVAELTQRIKQYDPTAEVKLRRNKNGAISANRYQTQSLLSQLNTVSKGNAFKAVYLHGVNVGQSSRAEGSFTRGYRLDRVRRSSLTGQQVNADIATARAGTDYTNDIQSAFAVVDQIRNSPNVSSGVKTALNQLSSGRISSKSLKTLTQALEQSPEDLAVFCRNLGLQ